jgi:hypothetical protein
MKINSPERCHVMIGQEASGETRHHAADHISRELKAEGLEADRLHADGVLPRPAQDTAEAGGDDRTGQCIGSEQAEQADPIEGEVVL